MPEYLPRLRPGIPVAKPDGTAAEIFVLQWQTLVEKIEAAEAAQNEIIADILAVTQRTRRTGSYTSPTAVLTASDAGATATITIASHARIYPDATSVAITGAAVTGLAFSTTYAVYYDDATLASTTPTFVASTNIADGYVGAAPGRHVLGVITTPPNGGAPETGGGAYPPGVSVGGEIV